MLRPALLQPKELGYATGTGSALFVHGCQPYRADLIFNDGQTHTLTMSVADNVQIYDSPTGQPTTLIVVGTIDVATLNVHGHSVLHVLGGAPLQTSAIRADGFATLSVANAETGVLRVSGSATATFGSLNIHNGLVDVSGFARASGNLVSDAPNFSLSTEGNGVLDLFGNRFNYPDGPLPVDVGTLTGFDGRLGTAASFTGGRHIYLNASPVPTLPAPGSLALALTAAACLAARQASKTC